MARGDKTRTTGEILQQVLDPTADALDVVAGGNVAHDDPDAGNPVKVGGRAVIAAGTTVSPADRTDFVTDTTSRIITSPYAARDAWQSVITAAITDTTSTQLFASAGSGIRNHITTITVTNSHATVGTVVTVRDNTTALWNCYVPALSTHSATFPVPLRGSTATIVTAICTTTGSNIFVSAVGFKWS